MTQSQCAQLPDSNFNQGKTCTEVNCEDCDCDWDGTDWIQVTASQTLGTPHVCNMYEDIQCVVISEDSRYKVYEFDGTLACGDEYYIRYRCDKTIAAPQSDSDPRKWEILEVNFPCFDNWKWRRATAQDVIDYGGLFTNNFSNLGTCTEPPNFLLENAKFGRDQCNCCDSIK